jgi:hypothetical protein
MRSLVSIFATTCLLATTVSAQNRVEFGGLSAWELTKGVEVQTDCEVELIDEVTDEVYCFSSEAAKRSFERNLEGNIVKAMAAYEQLLPHADARSSPLLAAPLFLPLQGNTLYVNNVFNNGNPSSLFTIQHSNAAKTLVGSMGRSATDVAFKGSTLFGLTFSQFLRVNPTTGSSTVVGNFGSGITDINALVVSPSGTIFAAGVNDGKFISINPTTGKGTLLGDYGTFVKNGQNREIISSGDLAFHNGVLFATVRLEGLSTSNDFLATINSTFTN